MRKYLLLLFSFISLTATFQSFGQETATNFKVENDVLMWQKTYEIPVDFKEYLSFIKLKNCLENIDTLQHTIVGRVRRFKLNTFGQPRMQTTIYIRDDATFADVKIEFKENRYRVTVYNIKIVSESNSGLSSVGEVVDLERYYYKSFNSNKVPRPGFLKNDDPIFDKNYDGFFAYKKSSSDF